MGIKSKVVWVLLAIWTRLRERCIAGCSSGNAGVDCDLNLTGKLNTLLIWASADLLDKPLGWSTV
jgi:hypothetical protein